MFIILVSAFAGRYFTYGLILSICLILFMILQRILDVINFNNPISLSCFEGTWGMYFWTLGCPGVHSLGPTLTQFIWYHLFHI